MGTYKENVANSLAESVVIEQGATVLNQRMVDLSDIKKKFFWNAVIFIMVDTETEMC